MEIWNYVKNKYLLNTPQTWKKLSQFKSMYLRFTPPTKKGLWGLKGWYSLQYCCGKSERKVGGVFYCPYILSYYTPPLMVVSYERGGGWESLLQRLFPFKEGKVGGVYTSMNEWIWNPIPLCFAQIHQMITNFFNNW